MPYLRSSVTLSMISLASVIRGVSIATGYGLDGPGSVPGSARFFSPRERPDRLWGPPSLPSDGYQGLSPQGCEADHSPPSSAEVKKVGAISRISHVSSWHGA
jgi:hypothetical protein